MRLESADLDATVAFYQGLLGLRVVDRWEEEGDRGVIFSVGDLGSEGFLEFGGVEGRRPVPPVSVQLRVDDMEAVVARLRGRWPFRGPETRPWGSVYLYLEDPDGIPVILYVGTV